MFLLETSWKSFKDLIPDLRKQIGVLKKTSADHLKQLEDQLSSSEVSNLRSAVSNYVADWLQVVIQLIDGSTEGNPSFNGQTLEQENIEYGYFNSIQSQMLLIGWITRISQSM